MKKIKQIKKIIVAFIILLAVSGITAIPIDLQLNLILKFIPQNNILSNWLTKVLTAYETVKIQYPFLLYGYDWLAFAHIILAILFYGPYKDPVKNIWVIQFGLIACTLVLPLAFVAGYFRNIPFWWQLIDSCFGIIGFAVLWICYKKILLLQKSQESIIKN